MTDEAIRIFLARDLQQTAREPQEHEETQMTCLWLPLHTAVGRVLAGEIESAMTGLGLLAAAHAVREHFRRLRPADSPWPSRKQPDHRR